MNPQLKLFIFAISLIALLVFQAKGVMPVVHDIVSSDLFLEQSDDEASQIALTNDMTNFAFNHCNTHIKDEVGEDFSLTFSNQPLNVWTMGNYQYVVNAEVELMPADAASFIRRYVCRINYKEKDDLSLAGSNDNWSVVGLSGLDEL